jgi:hypothetical protein
MHIYIIHKYQRHPLLLTMPSYLPEYIRTEILSYGDVAVTNKFKQVLCQLQYNFKEYTYQTTENSLSCWRGYPFRQFVLHRALQKNSTSENHRPIINTTAAGMYTLRWILL